MNPRAGDPTGSRLYRIQWVPGTDTLRGVCHCGAERTAEEPVELWEWLLAHPRDHRTPERLREVPDPPARIEVPV
ncbi:hypothetical protein O7627_15690 [Solwaraspora sp. WMMD1047]|uniref:hypothetical protein n=1 Tax=Solwaraspora sp. WMMD1047 TaxID=3016102 RepID=UPI0024167BA5|nr:hypothetical protein [Solwaraspora sp. WMMD1047]MDG4830737.1 hypothetical protein [Solwaraspora sp. WMMD1047]